jgi:hypothetical protein
MPEKQIHGLDFEKWIKDTFFESYVQTSYTDKWDATSVVFKKEFLTHAITFQGLPVSIKTCKYSAPIGFGDAIRQYENSQDFLLFVGFWTNAGSARKYVSVKAVKISKTDWHGLFTGAVSEEELVEDRLESEETEFKQIGSKLYHLDETIKTTPFYKKARELAKAEKKALPEMQIVVNPKIDSKNQRRLQCSLPFKIFWSRFAGEEAFKNDNCTFWGEKVPLMQ